MDMRQIVLCLTFAVGVLPVGSVEASQSLERSQRAFFTGLRWQHPTKGGASSC